VVGQQAPEVEAGMGRGRVSHNRVQSTQQQACIVCN
jgi:hypothetical protein